MFSLVNLKDPLGPPSNSSNRENHTILHTRSIEKFSKAYRFFKNFLRPYLFILQEGVEVEAQVEQVVFICHDNLVGPRI